MAEWGEITKSGKRRFKTSDFGVALCQDTLDIWVHLILLYIYTVIFIQAFEPHANFSSMLSGCPPPADESVNKVACRDTWLVAEQRQQCLAACRVPTLPDSQLSNQSAPLVVMVLVVMERGALRHLPGLRSTVSDASLQKKRDSLSASVSVSASFSSLRKS